MKENFLTVIPAKAGIISFYYPVYLFFYVIQFCDAPTSIDLSYDLDKGSLHVEAAHPSFDLNKSFVRLMNVYVNGNEVLTQDYYRQTDYDKFTDDVPITAQVGDVIKVELFCSLGGDMSKELTVAKSKEAPPADQSAT